MSPKSEKEEEATASEIDPPCASIPRRECRLLPQSIYLFPNKHTLGPNKGSGSVEDVLKESMQAKKNNDKNGPSITRLTYPRVL